MPVKRVTPPEAAELLKAGWKYVDVRSIPEFLDGHPAGAYNVPLLHLQPGRGNMSPNPDFERVMAQQFPKSTQLVVGCRAGPRSARATEMLAAAGFTNLVDMRGGWDGERDPFGRVTLPGWRDSGLPAEKAAEPGRSWEELAK